MILEVTATVNGGLCGRCHRAKEGTESRQRIDDAVRGWTEKPETLPGTNGIPEPDDLALAVAASQVRSQLFPTEEDLMERSCHQHFGKAYAKWKRYGSLLLTTKEKHTLAVETFFGEVWNGGLQQFLGNESGAFANWAEEAFAAMGIPEYADLMKNVKALFPDAKIPSNSAKRWATLETIDDGTLERLEDLVWRKTEADPTEIRRKLYRYLND